MKHLLLGFFCFLFSLNLSAQKVDTLLQESWNGTAWVNAARTITTYNAACDVASTLSQIWDETSGTWINSALTSYTYTGSNILTELNQQWDIVSSSWTNISRSTYAYDASSKVTSIVNETWINNAWQNSDRETYTYDGNGYQATTLTETWNVALSNWVNSTLVTNTNNSDGTVAVSITQNWNTATSAWVNDNRETYTYNGDKTASVELTEIWDATSAAWENESRLTFTYTAGKVRTGLAETWDTDHWVNSSLFTYTYNASNYLINTLFQSWDDATSAWVNNFQSNYTYNGDGTIHQIVSQIWLGTLWLNQLRQTFSYTNSCAALPLTLLNLNAVRNNNQVLVNWKTEQEINTSHFTVESSLDATTFKKIGDVQAKGSSPSPNNYSFTDNISNIKADKIYYRLLMADKDGKSSYSKIVSITLPGGHDFFVIKPNPAKSYFIIAPQVTYNLSNTTVTVSDFTGHMVIKQNIHQDIEQKINISNLAKGVYNVSIITAEGVKTQKLVVD